MGTNNSENGGKWITRVISAGKDLVALLRDGTLFLFAVLLIVFPTQFNAILVSAGFEEGSIVSFKWKANLVKSNQALEEARETIADLQRKNDELLNEIAGAKGEVKNPVTEERLAKLEDENRRLKDVTKQVQTNVSQTIESNLPLVEKALSSPRQLPSAPYAKSDYLVGLQTLGVPDAKRIAINEKLQSQGYTLSPMTYSYQAGERPSWFALRSTVFYYSASALPAARQLANFLQTVTGQDFDVQRGAGLGVDPDSKNVTLYVHYVVD